MAEQDPEHVALMRGDPLLIPSEPFQMQGASLLVSCRGETEPALLSSSCNLAEGFASCLVRSIPSRLARFAASRCAFRSLRLTETWFESADAHRSLRFETTYLLSGLF